MDDNKLPTGTGKWYKSVNTKTGAVAGKVNVNDSIARLVDFEKNEELIISWNMEKRELCMKPLTY